MITARDLNAMLDPKIFRPFRIVQTDGTAFDVNKPGDIFVTLRYVMVGLDPDPEWLQFERHATLNMIHILRVEELPTPAATTA